MTTSSQAASLQVRQILVLGLAMFLEAAGYGIVAPTLPELARQLELGHQQLGILFAIYALVGLGLVLPLGYAADRWGRKVLITLGLALLTCASIGYIFAHDYLWLAVARAAQGAGGTSIWVASLTMGGDLASRRTAGREVAWITGAWSLGFLLGPALGGIGDVRLPFVTYAAICLVALVLSSTLLRETHIAPIDLSATRLWRLAALPEVQCSSLATFALAFYYGSFDAFVPWLLDSRGSRRLEIAILFSALALPSVLLPRTAGRSADRLGDRAILYFGLPANGLLAIGFLELIARFPLWLGFLALGVTEVAIYIPAIAMLQRAVGNRDRGTAMSLHILCFSGGFVLGPVASALVITKVGYEGMFLLMGLVMLATLVVANLLTGLHGNRTARSGRTASSGGTPSSRRHLGVPGAAAADWTEAEGPAAAERTPTPVE